MSAVTIVLAILATYRVAFLVTSEDGPFELATRFRALFGQRTWVGRGFHCVFCVSFWLSMIPALYLGWAWSLPQADVALLWLGIAGGVVVVARMAR